MAGPSEKQIETQVLTFLNYQPDCFAFKVNTTGIYDEKRKCFRKITNRFVMKGTSDIIGLCKGRFFALEVKTPQTIKRALGAENDQTLFIRRINARGGIGAFVSSVEEAEQVLFKIRRLAHSNQ